MGKTVVEDQTVDKQTSEGPETSRKRNWILGIVVVLAGAALFAGGYFLATSSSDSSGDFADGAVDSLALQQVIQLSGRADVIVDEVRGADDVTKAQQKGIELQSVAVSVQDSASQIQDEELRTAATDLGDGYLDVSVGLITNNGGRVAQGAEKITSGSEALALIVNPDAAENGEEDSSPPAEEQPVDEPPAEDQPSEE